MNKINNTSVVKQQYANANNLNTRISIHDKYSTNKMGFGNWIMSNYRIDEKMKVLMVDQFLPNSVYVEQEICGRIASL